MLAKKILIYEGQGELGRRKGGRRSGSNRRRSRSRMRRRSGPESNFPIHFEKVSKREVHVVCACVFAIFKKTR